MDSYFDPNELERFIGSGPAEIRAPQKHIWLSVALLAAVLLRLVGRRALRFPVPPSGGEMLVTRDGGLTVAEIRDDDGAIIGRFSFTLQPTMPAVGGAADDRPWAVDVAWLHSTTPAEVFTELEEGVRRGLEGLFDSCFGLGRDQR